MMRGAELDRLENRPDRKGHHPSTLLHPNGTALRCADPGMNAVLAMLIFAAATEVHCRYCGETITYRRSRPQSVWLHDADGEYQCEDGHAEPAPEYYQRKATVTA